MEKKSITINGVRLPLLVLDTAVIGTGCAGFNAADWLHTLGRRDIAILTEGVNMGTSRNTGSDKQTYYKLTLASDGGDSVAEMAQTLFEGGGVHGDIALTEAACSVRSFIRLANLGVPFPTNEYGEYVGYKTDHDPRQRATSAGPLTSKFMTECLERSVRDKDIPILDHMTAVELIVESGRLEGLLCLNKDERNAPHRGLTVVRARQVILATGGPAGCYLTSVYPGSQTGMSGMALAAGAKAANLQEWQYGLASIGFRWNVSGTYQQVLPKYIAVDAKGQEREFLTEYFSDPLEALNMEFLKGYQWPFDSAKAEGSSAIDLIVHHEVFDLGNRVYMDFRTDPTGLQGGFEGLGEEAFRYLKNSGALLKTPIARLKKMNPLAIDLYLEHGIDLTREPLEISVCAQHHNGGIAVDSHWQSTLPGLYVAGEAAGTFGGHRPGGSALNSTQVGSLRAAEHIAYETRAELTLPPSFLDKAGRQAKTLLEEWNGALARGGPSNAAKLRGEMQKRMSACAAELRDVQKIEELERDLRDTLARFYEVNRIETAEELPLLLKNKDIFLTQLAVLSAMKQAADAFGSRGSALVVSREGTPAACLPSLSYLPQKPQEKNLVLSTRVENGTAVSWMEEVRPLPHPDGWFETVWEAYRERTQKKN